jgi:hypothetical protein
LCKDINILASNLGRTEELRRKFAKGAKLKKAILAKRGKKPKV